MNPDDLIMAKASPAGLGRITTGSEKSKRNRYAIPEHIALLDEWVVRACLGDPEYSRIIIEMPPRHGKSQHISRFTPAWFVGRNPDKRVILCSYNDAFASRWGRRARTVLEDYGPEIFGVRVDNRSKAANRWDIMDHDGGMITAGVGGAITGEGADLMVIDDPTKNVQEALSETRRELHKDWWQSTASTRLEPGGVVIVLMARWHPDDLAGFLQDPNQCDDAKQWKVLTLPALAKENDQMGREPGEPLWPRRFNHSTLAKRKASSGSRWFDATWQQDPKAIAEGMMFQRQWFKIVEEIPSNVVQWGRYWDMAATEVTAEEQSTSKGQNTPWTRGGKIGVTDDGRVVIADMVGIQGRAKAKEDLILQTAQLDGRTCRIRMEQEGGASGVDVIDAYRTLLMGYDFDGEVPRGDKVVRAIPASALTEAGRILLVVGPWITDFLNEIVKFPFGTIKDQVDVLSAGVNDLTTKTKPAIATSKKKKGKQAKDPVELMREWTQRDRVNI